MYFTQYFDRFLKHYYILLFVLTNVYIYLCHRKKINRKTLKVKIMTKNEKEIARIEYLKSKNFVYKSDFELVTGLPSSTGSTIQLLKKRSQKEFLSNGGTLNGKRYNS